MIARSLCLAMTLVVPLQAQDQNHAKPVVIAAKKTPSSNAESVAISEDGQYVAAGFGGPSNGRFPLKANGGGVFVWEQKSGKQVFSRGEFGDVIKVAFSRDSRYFAYSRIYTPGDSVEANTTVLIDLRSKEVVKRWNTAAFAISPTDDLMVVSGSRATEVWDLSSLNVIRTVDVRGSRAFAFSGDGKTVAALCYYWANNIGKPTGLSIFALGGDDPPQVVSHASIRSACAITISADSKFIVTGHTGGQARIWDAKDGSEVKALTVESTLAVFPFFLHQGKTLVLATQPANGTSWQYDQTERSGFQFKSSKAPPSSDLFLFDLPTFQPKRSWRLEDASYRTYYARFGSARDYPEYNPARFDVSTDGNILMTPCNGCCAVNPVTGKLLRVYERSHQAK